MKVNYGNEQTGICISSLSVGETFFANRKSTSGRGLYMKVDANSGVMRSHSGRVYAINLETGQLREFTTDSIVDKVQAEVTFPKR